MIHRLLRFKVEHYALLIALAAVAATAWIGAHIFENLPHVEDEVAYVWQANIIARGNLTLPSPVCPKCFLVPFVIDHNGLRFGKYPIAWPVVLSFAVRVGKRAWLPPLLAGINIWFAFRLFQKVVSGKTALLAAFLMASSPFFLMNASSLLAHNWALFLTLVFILGWFDTFISEFTPVPKWMTTIAAAISLGLLVLTRPMTAAGVALPFFIHGLFLLTGRDRLKRRRILAVGLAAGLLTSLHFVWQLAVTGDPLLNPYELWWPYDRIGFGPGIGLQDGGFSLRAAYSNTRFSLKVGSHDLFGWPYLSFIFVPFGILALYKDSKAWLAGLVFPSLVLVYHFYWIGAWLFGPRYYFEGIPGMALLTAAGIHYLAGKGSDTLASFLPAAVNTIKTVVISSLVCVLIWGNLVFYLPTRIHSLYGLYGHNHARLDPFLTAQARQFAPALIIVHMQHDWVEYGTLLELSSPYNDTPFVFTFSRGDELDSQVEAQFPERNIFHYYADEPYKFYNSPRPEP